MTTRGALLASLLLATPAVAEPIGALTAGSELAVTGPGPVQRVDGAAIVYLTRRLGLDARLGRVALDGDSGVATVGIAYRAAAARPKLDVVVDLGAGVAWPRAPAATAGVVTYLWPTRFPVALTTQVRTYVLIDDHPGPVAFSLGIGLALAR